MRKLFLLVFVTCIGHGVFAQNALFIPPTLTGDTFNLTVQDGVTQFYPGINTPTYGINGALLAPTLIVNKWDWVTMNVTNNLAGFGNSTTMHWHGLHVPAMDDGGPHQVIAQGSTWSPYFRILNSAGTFWYHPHGDNKTDRHVSKGIAGMIIVKDSAEAALTLPRTYGVDDFPIIVQTKAFDVLNQIAISTELDTAVCVNGTVHPFLDAPAQVIRMRLLNGSSMRTFNFGFTGNKSFKMIATDGGLLDSAITLTRIRLSPGERAEILVDLQGQQGDTLFLNSYSSELPNGIHGADSVVGMMGGTIPDYDLNPLNGADFGILEIHVVAPSGSPVTTLPGLLVLNAPWSGFTVSRNFNLAPDSMMCAPCQVEGTFNINGAHFDMNTINVTTYLNNTEKWRITNQTGIAHPFHIHDMHFYLLNVNGGPVPGYLEGKKDVVLVMPRQYVEFITRFEDFADDSIPYMYHCHMLHHEDEGMMGSFRVMDTTATGVSEIDPGNTIHVFPNPAKGILTISLPGSEKCRLSLFNSMGEKIYHAEANSHFQIYTSGFSPGMYLLQIRYGNQFITKKIIIQ